VDHLRFSSIKTQALPVVVDLQGSKWRLGQFEARRLASGSQIRLVLGETSRQADVLPVPHADFFTAAPHSSRKFA
jgi:pyruvate kinase